MTNVKFTTRPVNTFSIVGFDPETNELGVAVASKFLSVGAVVPYAKAGVGAVATQSWANLEYGTKGLELLESGDSPEEVIEELTKSDERKSYRQVGIVDAKGNSATFTGEDSYDWAGGKTGKNFAVQGNILVDEGVVDRMSEAFLGASGTLADRLLKALKAGDDAGGDSRGKQSAALLIVKENGSYGGYNDKYIDLRVDDHEEPVKELERIYELHQLYFNKTAEEDVLAISESVADELRKFLTVLEYLESEQCDDDMLKEAIQSYHLIENFDERVQPEGFIDKKVLEFIKKSAIESM
ncbi:DUF1028 domain-containing protein [Sporosarcina sp. FSL W7-1349]|uniref:DUF1028 domain-containing protein n=1 Tax=Sporosarcina sp. FSL W7-1349 TaxID=2921561 RepID=UPI0030F76563